MGLLPLEFTDCLQDSPYFRDSLHSHEKELERTSQAIKELIKEVKTLLSAAKTLSQAQRRLSQRLVDFKFECIGSRQTDDELVIAGSLKEFGKLIAAIEDEKDRMLERAYEQFIEPLERFRREQIGAVKERKKKFEKQTAKFCASQERYLGLSTKKQDTVLQEADATVEMEQRDFIRAGLEYVCLIQEVQERKKFEFVETLLTFMYGWLTFYHQGHEVATDFKPHMLELQARIQKSRESFNASREDIHALMRKMLEVRTNSKPIDPGTLNKLYTRTGYLFLMEKKALGTTWNKYYCHYQRSSRLFCMVPYNQTTAKVLSNETFKIKACIKRISDTIDKRFCFDIVPEDKPNTVYTYQALSEEDLELWLDAMDGKEPVYERPLRPSDASQTFLDEAGFNFVQRCIQVLEYRGLEEQGLYRVVGVASKVTKLLTMGLDRRKVDKLNLDDGLEWESKTITSGIKTFFRNLPQPIMTYKCHHHFIEAGKLDSYEDRVSEVQRLVDAHIPASNKKMLELLLQHLENVAIKSDKNYMSISNLGVCFGPTLLRAEEETVAAIMDIKFANVVVEIMIENWRQIFCGEPFTGKRLHGDAPVTPGHRRSSLDATASPIRSPTSAAGLTTSSAAAAGLTVLPIPQPHSASFHNPPHLQPPQKPPPPPSKTPSSRSLAAAAAAAASSASSSSSPPQRPPPPYTNPPPPPLSSGAAMSTSATSLIGGSVATFAHAVIYNNGPKQALVTNKSPPTHSPPAPPPPPITSASSLVPHATPPSSAPPSYATWERTSSGGVGPAGVPPPLSSAPPVGLTTPPGAGGGASKGPVKSSMQQLQRQLSAGQSSIQSFSGSSLSAFAPDDPSSSGPSPKIGQHLHHHAAGAAAGQPHHHPHLHHHQPPHGQQQLHPQHPQPSRPSKGSSSSSVESLTSERSGRDAATTATRPKAAPRPSLTGTSSLLQQPQPFAPNNQSSPDSGLQTPGAAATMNSGSPASSSTAEYRSVRTLYACVAEHETELSFEPNQIITSVRPSLEPGWLEGCLDGKVGLVPENYVEFI